MNENEREEGRAAPEPAAGGREPVEPEPRAEADEPGVDVPPLTGLPPDVTIPPEPDEDGEAAPEDDPDDSYGISPRGGLYVALYIVGFAILLIVYIWYSTS